MTHSAYPAILDRCVAAIVKELEQFEDKDRVKSNR